MAACDDTIKILSWNIASIRTYDKGEFVSFVRRQKPDILCFTETKVLQNKYDLPDEVNNYFPYQYWNDSVKGQSGTLVLSKIKAHSVDISPFDNEGRFIGLDFDNFYLINVYVPNSGRELKRLSYRINEWEPQMRDFVQNKMYKNVIIAGDLNVAPTSLDIHSDKIKNKAGVTIEERAEFQKLLDIGMVDTFREKHPQTKKYSYWSYFGKARDNNKGWRLDHFLTTPNIRVITSDILTSVRGSDHAPLVLKIEKN